MADVLAVTSAGSPVLDLGAFGAAVFDLDGVLTQTAAVHAAAWKELFDDVLRRRAVGLREPFRPFEGEDYRRYVDGKPRLDGIRDFLEARGIVLPEGGAGDPADADTIWRLGARKNALFNAALQRQGVRVFDSTVAFLRVVRQAGLKTAVVSASKNTGAVLAATGLGPYFDVCIDGVEAERLGLRGKPAPDTFLQAVRSLGVEPARAIGLEDSVAGVQAIHAAGFGLTIGIDRAGQAASLAGNGADLVVRDLSEVEVRLPWAASPPVAADAPTSTPPRAELPIEAAAEPEWALVETGFTLAREHEVESLFAIANGYVGVRASLMEGGALSSPATFVAGVFDAPAGGPQLATAPDWTRLSVLVNGAPLQLDSGRLIEHRRTLDLKRAIFWREWRHEDPAGRITRVRGLRLASAADPHLMLQSATLTAENHVGMVSVDAAVVGTLAKLTSGGVTIAVGTATRAVDSQGRELVPPPSEAPLTLTVELGATYRMDRVVALYTSRDTEAPAAKARDHALAAMAASPDTLIRRHVQAWADRWAACDIRIDGDPDAQRALRFAIYHLLSAANPEDARTSIGARALTGRAYQGHVFWDTEIFMLPFFILTSPAAAKALLMYRFHTLPAARRRAAALGFRGALFAWESADTGDDVTPPAVVGPDGRVEQILTGSLEQHISADVAYGAWQYWRATADADFLCGPGAEILIETARFWASRATPGPDGLLHINGVIGPDEYHENVDDNAYTNGIAAWNLRTAARVAALLAERWPDHWRTLSQRLSLNSDEAGEWRRSADRLYTGLQEDTGLIEQFCGYFGLEDIDLARFEPRSAPIDLLLGRERVQRSRIIKQPDVLMLLHLLWDEFPLRVHEANFRYYEPRCAHGSSLSPAMHALLAARLGRADLALRYFRQTIDIDLADNMGNAAGGVHVAALGGLWQAAVFGFAGLRLGDDDVPHHQPNLPPEWKRFSMRFKWRGHSHDLDLSPGDPPAGGSAHA